MKLIPNRIIIFLELWIFYWRGLSWTLKKRKLELKLRPIILPERESNEKEK